MSATSKAALTPGRVWYLLYPLPAGRVMRSWREGGPVNQWITERHRREMEAAAARLPALPEFPGTAPVTLHLLTGRMFWYQTAFCLHSFARAAQTTVHAEIYDDGSIDAGCAACLRRLGGSVRLHAAGEIRAQLDRHLPTEKFSVLRERWLHYPNIRKLTDVHLGSTGWKLVVDSDLLFFRRPALLLDWFAEPERPLHAVDCQESYGYSRPLLERLAGAPLPARVNVGICGLRSEALDWNELEAWCAELIAKERPHYYLEQALVAMLAARQPCTVAPAADYITMPDRSEVMAPRAVMHHYVDTSRRWLYRHGWRQIPSAPS